jgi:hypothetical protein
MLLRILRIWLFPHHVVVIKNLHQSTEERNFISSDQNISGKNFGFYLSLSQITLVGDNIYIFVYYYYYYCCCCCLLSQAFLPGTSLESTVIPTAQASSLI